MELKKYLDRSGKNKIVLIGDFMLDKYIFGKVERISLEAPITLNELKQNINGQCAVKQFF